MNKYVVRLTDAAADDPSLIESVANELAGLGARNIEVHGMGFLTVDSPVALNFAAITGVAEAQEAREVNENETHE